ncbi:hypothetical protein [Crossiella cryophila]|uniref:Uncharacterized protein n=1 Tax=Crossiella cryophila TaxID=43355 RepID=A0A7W7CCS3_9PSEU|nr:hypothetical protein [Crossiella cryophila]MBB4678731.1 hypothetical protein [Crossiella cryophila]
MTALLGTCASLIALPAAASAAPQEQFECQAPVTQASADGTRKATFTFCAYGKQGKVVYQIRMSNIQIGGVPELTPSIWAYESVFAGGKTPASDRYGPTTISSGAGEIVGPESEIQTGEGLVKVSVTARDYLLDPLDTSTVEAKLGQEVVVPN